MTKSAPPPTTSAQGTPNWNNRTLFHGDNLDVMRGMNSNTVDLIATDPPFNKSKDFHATPDHLDKKDLPMFEDRWSWERDVHQEWVDQIERNYPAIRKGIDFARSSYSDGMGAYMCFMAVRLLEMRRLLKPTGSIYLHCDPTASHYLKTVMDAIFGKDQFRNQIIWCYGSPGKPNRWFPRKHDVILFYAKEKANKFNGNAVLVPHKRIDKRLKKFGHAGEFAKDTPRDVLEQGKLPFDWWDGIAPSYKKPKEYRGYPTQKPEELYQRIIKASSNKGDVVLDPFCGCATTCIAAEIEGRQWVGIDIWKGSHHLVIDGIKKKGLSQEGEDSFTLFSENFHYKTDVPKRTDEEEEEKDFIPYFKTPRKRILAKWERLSPSKIREILEKAQDQDNDGFIECAGCGRDLEKEFMEIDHIQPKRGGGNDTIDNRILLCAPCNRRKSASLALPGLWKANEASGWMSQQTVAENALKAARDAAEEQKILLP